MSEREGTTATARARAQLSDLQASRPDVVALATLTSLGVRIEREFMRRARLKFGHHFSADWPLNVATEAGLWFSPLVKSRGVDAITLIPEFAGLLRDNLRSRPTLLTAVWEEMQRCHRDSPPVVRWEEKIIYLSLAGSTPELTSQIEAKIKEALKAVSTGKRSGLQEWIIDMWPRLPQSARSNTLMNQLRNICHAEMQRQAATSNPLSSSESGVITRADFTHVETITLDVRDAPGVVQIGFVVTGGTAGLRVPAIFPITLKVKNYSRSDADFQTETTVVIPNDGFVEIPGKAANLRVTTIDGHKYSLAATAPLAELIQPASSEMNDRFMFDFSGHGLKQIPKHVFAHRELQSLTLANNRLTSLDPRLAELKNLMYLDISGNRLSALPGFLAELPRLETLLANNNRITALAPQISKCPRLRGLYLMKNRLSVLPRQLGDMEHLETLHISQNPLRGLPSGLRESDEDGRTILEHLHSLSETATYNSNAKVVLLGDTGVGKTALSRRLVNATFEPTESTHGMNISLLNSTEVESAGREVRLWDLAEQPDYLLHRTWLDDIDLAIVVVSGELVTWHDGVAYWTNLLPDANTPRLLVHARADRESVDPKLAEDFARARGFVGFIATSAKSGLAIAELRAEIFSAVLSQSKPLKSEPQDFQSFREAILKLRDLPPNLCLSTDELELALLEHLPGKLRKRRGEVRFRSLMRSAVKQLAKDGVVFAYDRSDFVLLRPELLSAYAASIFQAAREYSDGKGIIQEDDVLAGNLSFSHERLPQVEEGRLLFTLVQLLLDRSICLRLKGGGLLFPSAVRGQAPGRHEPGPGIEFKLSGKTEDVFYTTIARLSYRGPFRLQKIWYDAAEFESPAKPIRLEFSRKAEQEQSALLVRLQSEPLTQFDLGFIRLVEDVLQEFGGVEVTREPYIVCPKCNLRQDVQVVRKAIEASRSSLRCMNCDSQVPLKDPLELQLDRIDLQSILESPPTLHVSGIPRADHSTPPETAKDTRQRGREIKKETARRAPKERKPAMRHLSKRTSKKA